MLQPQKEVLQKLATNENTGLTENEARNGLWKYDPNVLREEKRLVQLIVNQFRARVLVAMIRTY